MEHELSENRGLSDLIARPVPAIGCKHLWVNERVFPGPLPPGEYLPLSGAGGKDNVYSPRLSFPDTAPTYIVLITISFQKLVLSDQ